MQTPRRPTFAEPPPPQKTYGFDEGECDFDLTRYAGPPLFEGLVMPPPPVMPPPANTFAYPPNFELYARAHALRWAQRILLDEFGEAARRGGDDDEKTSDDDDRSPGQSPEKETTKPVTCDDETRARLRKARAGASVDVSNGVEEKKELVADAARSTPPPPPQKKSPTGTPPSGVHHDSTNWYERVEHVRVSFDVVVNGVETTHECDWASPPPPAVVHMLETEPIPAFATPALGMYHEDVRTIGHKAQDAALLAAVEYICEWAVVEKEGAVLDPFRDIREMRFTFEVLTKRGKRRTATRAHAGGPNDRMNAFKAAITRVRGW
jgi:hypothetical protein